MTEKKLNRILAVVFLVVGILATANTFRLHTYINSTLPRDLQQEQCNTDTIKVLESWVNERIKRDDSMNARDDSIVRVLDELIAGQRPSPTDLQAWRDATAADREVRQNATLTHSPLPDCTPR